MFKYKKLSDEEIVRTVREKDKEAYSEIIRRYQDKLFRYAMYLIQDDIKAQDVVQDAFVKAYINLKGFDTKKKFGSWIYRITHNLAMDVLRRGKKLVRLEFESEFDGGINLEDSLVEKELRESARFCLKQIPVLYREPLTLFFLEEKSYEEISDILRIPIGTVGTRINRAKILLQKICRKIKN